MKIDKKLSASGGLCPLDPPPGTLSLDPAGGSALDPCYRLVLNALTMVPPLANPESAPDQYHRYAAALLATLIAGKQTVSFPEVS